MPGFRDTRTGVVVDVDDKTASDLGAAYEPVSDTKTTAKKATSSKSSK